MQDFESYTNGQKQLYFNVKKMAQHKIANDLKDVNEVVQKYNKKIKEFNEEIYFARLQRETEETHELNERLRQNVATLNTLQTDLSNLKNQEKKLQKTNKQLQEAESFLQEQHLFLQQQIIVAKQKLHKGLSSSRIQQFHTFPAGESLVGNQCGVCLEDIDLRRRMMRLDCNGQHIFCQGCVEGWFADHNTCPNCRHIFT